MTQELQLALIQLVIRVGTDTAILIMEGISNAKNIDDAIAALRAAQSKTWEDFKK